MASPAFDTFVTYRIISTLVTPWKEQAAFEHGIIDEKGKLLRKSNTLKQVMREILIHFFID